MILSMTGYGQGQFKGDDFVITINLKSVNHRHFDANLKLPQELQFFENKVKNALKERLVRGSVSATVMFDGAPGFVVKVNESLAAAYLQAAREVQEKFNLTSEISIDSLLRLPNVVTFGDGSLFANDQWAEKFGIALDLALNSAIDGVVKMRSLEGEHLEEDLRQRAKAIGERVEAIEKAMQMNTQAIYDKLRMDVLRLTQAVTLDPARLAQEVAYLAEKSDITEEVTRLKSHVKQFLALLEGEGEIGKRLDFLLQEMHREANTILSKSSNVFGEARVISDHALEIKTEIEKLREQVQNVV